MVESDWKSRIRSRTYFQLRSEGPSVKSAFSGTYIVENLGIAGFAGTPPEAYLLQRYAQ